MSRINVLHSRDQVHVIISVSTCLYINDKITRCVAVCAETICVYMKSKVCWLIFMCSHQIMNHIHWFSVILLHLVSLFYFSVDEDQCVQVWIRSGSITTQVIYHLNKGLNDDSKQLFIIRRRRWWVVMFWVNCSFKQTSVLPLMNESVLFGHFGLCAVTQWTSDCWLWSDGLCILSCVT